MAENQENNKKKQSETDSIVGGEKTTDDSKPQEKSSIRTYANDIARLIRSGTTLSDVALSEQKRRTAQGKNVETRKKAGGVNRIVVFVAVILIVSGILVLLGSFFLGGDENKSQNQVLTISSIIFANSKQEIPLGDAERIGALKQINQERNSTALPLGAIKQIYLTKEEEGGKKILGADDFLKLIRIRAGDAFVRALEKNFMLGVHSFDGNQGFLLFKIKSFDNALAKTIDWEEFMLDDLWPMFYNIKPSVNLEKSASLQGEFRDIILQNRDVRTLEDKDGKTALVYSFPDRRHLVITTDKRTMIEIFERLTTGRFKN